MMGTMTAPGLYFDTDGLHAGLVLPLGGVLIHAGDCANQGRAEEVQDFLQWFSEVAATESTVIPGVNLMPRLSSLDTKLGSAPANE